MPQTTVLTPEEWFALTDPADKIALLRPPVSERKLRLFGCHCCRRFWDSLSPEGRDALTVAERFADGAASDAERQTAFRRLIETSGGYVGPHTTGRAWRTALLSTDLFTCALALILATSNEILLSAETGRAICDTYEDIKQIRRTAESCRTARWLAADQARRQREETRSAVGRAWDRLLRGVAGRFLPSPEEQEVAYQTALVADVFGDPFWPATFSSEWRTDTAVLLAKQMYESDEFSATPILADALQDAGCDNEDALSHCREPNATHVRGCWVVDLVLNKS